MKIQELDTIAAIATAASDAGIGIIRVSGPNSISIVSKCYQNAKKEYDLEQHGANTITFGYFMNPQSGTIIDEVLVSVMKAPHSYTTEDVVEVNCHGGQLVINEVLQILLQQGCRLADPGEFTKRAFLNGRIDLSEAEAVMDLISAKSKFALENSRKQLRGGMYEKIKNLREQILYEQAFIESALDDPENYDLTGYPEQLSEKLMLFTQECDALLSTSEEGRLRKDGIRTAIIGRPNVGKSSLLNVLSGEERAIVTEIAGTTRDTIEETVRLGDILLNIIDTAGIRNTEDVVERIGVDKAKSVAEDADLLLYMIDATQRFSEEDNFIASLCKDKKAIVLLNKSDLKNQICLTEFDVKDFLFDQIGNNDISVISTSMNERFGINKLQEEISTLFYHGNLAPSDELYVTNIRHRDALLRTKESIVLVEKSIEMGMSEDFFSIDLQNAYASLGEIIGEEVGDDLVEEIFSKFCMGK